MAHWSSCATNNEPVSPAGPCDCGDDAPSEWENDRHKRGLSTEWRCYAGTGIEVFYDHGATIYRINGQIYTVPRQLGMIEQERLHQAHSELDRVMRATQKSPL
jgi:hypothetical protein